jgi:hypothetical protein
MSPSPAYPEPQVASVRRSDPEPPVDVKTVGRFNSLLFELGVEPSLTVQEAAAILRWSYWKARRYFREVDGICVSYRPKRYKRPYRTFTIPISVFAREWQKMTGHQPEAADIIRHRLASIIQK